MRTPLLLLAFLFGCLFTVNAQKSTRFGLYASGGNFTFPQKQNDFLLLFPKGSNQIQLQGGLVGNFGVWSDQSLGKRFRLYESLGFRYSRYQYDQSINLPEYQTVQKTTEATFCTTLPVLLYFTPLKWPKWSAFAGAGLSYINKHTVNIHTTEQIVPAPEAMYEEYDSFPEDSPLGGFAEAGLEYQLSTRTWVGLQYVAENTFRSHHFQPAGERYINPLGEGTGQSLKAGFGINMRSFSVSLRHQLWP